MAKWEFDSAGFSRSREFIFESCFPCSFLHLSCPCSRISDGSVGTFLLGILFGITVKVVPLHAVIVYIFLLSEFSQVHMACRGLTWTPYELRNILKTGKIVGKNFLGKGQPSWGGIWMSSGTSWKYSLENTLGGKKKKSNNNADFSSCVQEGQCAWFTWKRHGLTGELFWFELPSIMVRFCPSHKISVNSVLRAVK